MTKTATRTQSANEVLAEAATVGLRMWPDGPRIQYRAPGPIGAALRERITANKAAILKRLAAWDETEALQLMFDADEAVAKAGVSGRDEQIQRAADRCMAAHETRHMANLREACAQIEHRARELATTLPSAPGNRSPMPHETLSANACGANDGPNGRRAVEDARARQEQC
ncbi:hypothetical protein [Frigoriglobus tundricola]|uniref:Uncharacterized protein n=1 Tax=Frigoriglobus tundricola TaxID=2774151 RepID=A0A6M5Z5X3_9BACT|nr:hypothetical protein [Frigoriglobus tundricola]QJX01247.1 hypothetical protein FTUN_8886 [Frigoriglobus tundricola]